jgi:hypothetical protein
MTTIKSANGIDYVLGDEVYEIVDPEVSQEWWGNYGKGVLVRPIAEVPETPGDHFRGPKWITVCRIDAPGVEARGFRRSSLKRIK